VLRGFREVCAATKDRKRTPLIDIVHSWGSGGELPGRGGGRKGKGRPRNLMNTYTPWQSKDEAERLEEEGRGESCENHA